jgi:hypothetical protein
MNLRLFAGWRTRFAALAILLLTWPSAGQAQIANPNLSLTITEPTNGEVIASRSNLQIDALTYDPLGSVSAVAFTAIPTGIGPVPLFALYLGTVSNGIVLEPPTGHSELFICDWTNAMSGTWEVNAGTVGTLAQGAGASVRFTVLARSNSFLSLDIAAPTNGAVFPTPTTIQLIAGVQASNDSPVFLEFFDGDNSLGIAANGAVVDPPGSPGLPPGSLAFFLNWTNQSVGSHVLTAAVLDTNGLTFYSAPVSITIESNSVVSNLPPVVRVTSPPNNSVFRAPVNIALLAYANDPFGYIASVEFFAGSNSLGFGRPLPIPIAQPLTPTLPPIAAPTNIFELIWSNAPVGSFPITALATDNSGGSTTSAPVNITILPAPTPPTNLPDIVSIVATDPIAIAGTNCWPWLGLLNPSPTWSNWVSPVAVLRWFTNCGPKDATLTVHRQGQDTNDLSVAYSIGGTATNGVDYMTLPGVVTIPAGQCEATITIVPISDGATNRVSTVVLALTPSTNMPPDYRVGFPPDAEVIIIDNNWPRLAPLAALLPDRSFHLCLPGPEGAWFRIDYSTNLLYWTSLCTNQVIDGSIDFIDPDAAGSPERLYRTIPLAGPPTD